MAILIIFPHPLLHHTTKDVNQKIWFSPMMKWLTIFVFLSRFVLFFPNYAYPSEPILQGMRVGAVVDESLVQHVFYVSQEKTQQQVPHVDTTIREAFAKSLKCLNKGESVKIKIGKGIYRETLGHVILSDLARDTLLVIEGSEDGQTVWCGTEIYPSERWVPVTENIYMTDWPYQWGFWSQVWETEKVLGQRSEMVFLNGKLLRQVLLEDYDYVLDGKYYDFSAQKGDRIYKRSYRPQDVLLPGTYGVMERDDAGKYKNKLFVALPPNTKLQDGTLEVAVHRQAFRLDQGYFLGNGKNNLVLRNLTFRGFASRTKDWEAENVIALGRNSSHILVENCVFEWNNASGLFITGKNITIRNSVFRYNGFSGILGALSDSVMENNQTNYNNWRGYWGGRTGWWIGGVKMHNSERLLVRNHTSIGNLAAGFWCDVHCEYVVFENLTTLYNEEAGLFLELSNGPFYVSRLLSAWNQQTPLRVSCAANVFINDSILFSTTEEKEKVKIDSYPMPIVSYSYWLRQDDHAQQKLLSSGVLLIQNSVLMSGSKNGMIFHEHNGITREDPRYRQFRYQGRGNILYAPLLKEDDCRIVYVGEDWKEYTMDLKGWEQRWGETFLWVDPRFLDPSTGDFRLSPTSPLASRKTQLPCKRIDSKLLEQAREFRNWVTNQ